MAKNVGDRKCDKLWLSLLLFCWHDGFLNENILVLIFEHPKHHKPRPSRLGRTTPIIEWSVCISWPSLLFYYQKVYFLYVFFRKIGLKEGERGGERRENRLWTTGQIMMAIFISNSPNSCDMEVLLRPFLGHTFNKGWKMSFDILTFWVGRWNFATFMESLKIKFSHLE